MRTKLLTHYQLIQLVEKHKRTPNAILSAIERRIAENEQKIMILEQNTLSERFRMLEKIAEGNAIRRSAKRYQ